MANSFLNIFWLLLLLECTLWSCNKKKVGPQCEHCVDQQNNSKNDVIIGCEGNFGWANASISLYNPVSKTVSNGLFETRNGFAMGDVLQSITCIDGLLYVVMNNSGKIHVLDTSNYSVITTISGFTSPRYICKGLANKAFVSDLYANHIAVLNTQTHTIESHIAINNWTEQLLMVSNKLWVTCPDTNWILRIDMSSNQILDTLIVGTGVSSMVVDKNNKVWALASGGFAQHLPILKRFDGATGVLENSFAFASITDYPTNLTINSSKDELFFLNIDCYKMHINDNFLPNNAIVFANQSVFYGLAIHPFSNDIYIADSKDYVQPGVIYRYNTSNQLIDSFTVGTIPQCFWFK